MENKTVALIIVAGGTGTRMGNSLPKQFLKINGKTVIEHTLDVFCSTGIFKKIIIVSHSSYIDMIEDITKGYDADFTVTPGGSTRQESVCCGLWFAKDCEYVMIHDAVRCCITPDEIESMRDVLYKTGACALGVRVKDSIKLVNSSDNTIEKNIDRDNLWHIQTPQAFVTKDICRAHIDAKENNYTATDDTSVAEYAGIKVTLVPGKDTNIKLTTPADVVVAGEFLKNRVIQ